MNNFKNVQVKVEVNTNTEKENTMNKNDVLRLLAENGSKVEIKDSVVFINGINLDELKKEILAQGTVNYPARYRRWVMAQMFRALNHKKGYQGYLDSHNYDYVLKTTEDELKVLVKMQKENPEEFEIRKTFFTPQVIYRIARYTKEQIIKHAQERNSFYLYNYDYFYKAKRKGNNVTYSDWHRFTQLSFNKTLIRLESILDELAKCARYANPDYECVYFLFQEFRNYTIKLPERTKKPVAWVEAFKASGAYYTLENMIYNHGCVLELNGNFDSKKNLEIFRNRYCGIPTYYTDTAHEMGFGGYRFLGLLKETIKKNNFDFYREMDKKYNGYRW